MSVNVKYREEIISTLNQLEQEKKPVDSSSILFHLKDLVLKELNTLNTSSDFDLNNFKGIWNRRLKNCLESIGRKKCLKQVAEKTWRLILDEAAESSLVSDQAASTETSPTPKSSTSSLHYQQKLSNEDFLLLKSSYESIQNKWVLRSGTCVEDIMYEASRKFIYEHPSHSFIFSANDDIWKDYFSVEDLKEIKDSIEAKKVCEDMPKHLVDALLKLNKKKTYKEVYDVFKNIEADRHDDPELYWVKESVLDYIELFYNTNVAMFNSEQDLLDEVYGFIKKSRRISKTRTETVTGSRASAETKNKTRFLGTMEMLRRQMPGDLADLSFLHKSTEIGCLEIGLSDKGSNGTKELQEKSLKTPRMMKAFVIQAASSFPTIDISKVETVGFVISGMWIVGLKMKLDRGSVALLVTTKRLKMPESIEEVPALLPPVLNLVYSHAQTIKKTAEYIDDVSTSVSFGPNSELTLIPPCFVPLAKPNKKRKLEEI
ncbi:hypothetical protein BDF21DRAFT_488949 [Thamnidium elegans]|nr:hypothetical protein BDF21DRAFT_488949 [Thamnidium elegans]